jgi:gluconate 2-dehydrogenase gamma chain
MLDLHDRRMFLRTAMAAGAAWATADLGQVEAALAWSAEQTGAALTATTALSRADAAAVDAIASRILPAVDGRPGAHEAGAVYFIDRALATFNAAQHPLYTAGIADLNRRTAANRSRTTAFARLDAARQDALLREIERTPFFAAVYFDTIVGTFALPSWGGNRNFAGWHLLGLDHQPSFQAPFGAYDADINRKP